MAVYLRLLTDAHALLAGQRLEFRPNKALALLFYLALRGEWVSREELADLFRPDADEETARHYLRLMLSKVRKLPYAQGLEVTPQRLRWLVNSDVKDFRAVVGKQDLQNAVRLYERPLLSGLPRTALEAYEAWLELERASLHTRWQKATLELSKTLTPKEAVPLLRKLLEDTLLEEDIVQAFLRGCLAAND